MITRGINLLLVDDDAVDRRLIDRALARFSGTVQFTIETAGTLCEAVERLKSNSYDIVLLDLSLPDSSGVDTVKGVHAINSNIPIVVLTGLPDEKMGLSTIEEGAEDYLVKGKFSDNELMRTIRYALERKRREQEIKNAAKAWRTTFDSITDFIAILDKDFKILRVNKALANAYGVKPQELIGKTCCQTYQCTEHDRMTCPHAKTLKTREPSTTEMYQEQLGIYLEITTSPIFNADGRIDGSVHIAKDITQRKHGEQEMREQDRLKSEFVAAVSHEIRTPLAIFKNIISNALAGVMGKITPKLRENLEMANRTVDRLARIIGDFLDISKIEAGMMTLSLSQLEIQAVISDTVKTLTGLAEEKKIELKTYLCGQELMVKADREKIERVLVNLIGNAIKFVPQGGHIKIRAKAVDNTVAIEVEDDGPGIESGDLKKLFHRFVQLEKQVGPGEHGTGLGLAIAKELVELHGGRIEVRSARGSGTTFTVFLPISGRYNGLAALAHDNQALDAQPAPQGAAAEELPVHSSAI
jgi:PAS domain S-box-containing protein